jgi:hypothetical protein
MGIEWILLVFWIIIFLVLFRCSHQTSNLMLLTRKRHEECGAPLTTQLDSERSDLVKPPNCLELQSNIQVRFQLVNKWPVRNFISERWFAIDRHRREDMLPSAYWLHDSARSQEEIDCSLWSAPVHRGERKPNPSFVANIAARQNVQTRRTISSVEKNLLSIFTFCVRRTKSEDWIC